MTPLLTALSSLRDASRISTPAVSMSPASTAAWYFRIAVFSDDLTALLRSRAFSFWRLRLIWDLMFATRQPRPARFGCGFTPPVRGVTDCCGCISREEPDYQVSPGSAKTGTAT